MAEEEEDTVVDNMAKVAEVIEEVGELEVEFVARDEDEEVPRGVLFDKESLADHIPTQQYSANTVFTSVAFLRDEEDDTKFEDKMLRLLVLSCTKGGGSDDKKRVQTSTSSFGPNKRTRFSKESTYNRFFLVADLESPPSCAAILPRSAEESSQLLLLLTGGAFVGEPFYVYEPKRVDSTLGDYTPVLSLTNSPFLPQKDPSLEFRSTEASMALPGNVGETNYFILTKKSIQLTRIRPGANRTCQGVGCDRQKEKNGCSCLHATGSTSLVYECDVTFEVPARINPRGRTTVQNFSSLKTTKLFYSNYLNFVSRYQKTNLQESNVDTRRCWNTMVDYINQHGGWTLVGWFMLGDHTDAAGSTEKVQNYQITIHLSSLQPTLKEVLKHPDYVKELVDTNFTSAQTAAQIALDCSGVAKAPTANAAGVAGAAAAAGTSNNRGARTTNATAGRGRGRGRGKPASGKPAGKPKVG